MRLVHADLEVARGLGVEIGIAAEAEAVGAVRGTKRSAGRKDQARARGEVDAVFGVPGGLTAEGLVIRVCHREQQVMAAKGDAILYIAHVHRGVFIEPRAEYQRIGVLATEEHSGRHELVRAKVQIVLPVERVAARTGAIGRLVLLDIILDAAERQTATSRLQCRVPRPAPRSRW